MKCGVCHSGLDKDQAVIVALIHSRTYVLNMHRHCLRVVVGGKATDLLMSKTISAGWNQLALPGPEEAPVAS